MKMSERLLRLFFLDNYDDLTQGMDDQLEALNSIVTSTLNKWAQENGFF